MELTVFSYTVHPRTQVSVPPSVETEGSGELTTWYGHDQSVSHFLYTDEVVVGYIVYLIIKPKGLVAVKR